MKITIPIPALNFQAVILTWLTILTLAVAVLFYTAPPTATTPAAGQPFAGQTSLTKWTQQKASALIPAEYQSQVKTLFRQTYQETAAEIKSGEIQTTPQARQRVTQLMQAKITALKQTQQAAVIQASTPLSDAFGQYLPEHVEDNLPALQKAFGEIAAGLK
jgi:hypothetical protein